jgi:hypothetical protein
VIHITTRGMTAIVDFPYDEEAVDIIRTIPGRRWDRGAKHWIIPVDCVTLAAKRFESAGFTVTGDIPRPRPTASVVDPFGALLTAVPPKLRSPLYKSIARVLHPDAGGTTELMQQLNKAFDDHR